LISFNDAFDWDSAWDDIQTISLLMELHVSLSLRFSGCACFSNNNVSFIITGPKTVKLFSNKEHMGFRYDWSSLNFSKCIVFSI